MDNITRRELFKRGMLMASGAALAFGQRTANALACAFTPAQQEGPYYPETDLNRDADLTRFHPLGPVALGQVIYLSGRILDGNCQPIENASIEIWQACASGKYNHSDDPNALPLDPNFQYWGRLKTGADGVYRFKTIIPGHYPVTPTRMRPPHIHVKIHARGFLSLTTQVYFDPQSYDDLELARLVASLNAAEDVDTRLLIRYERISATEKAGKFDFTLRQ